MDFQSETFPSEQNIYGEWLRISHKRFSVKSDLEDSGGGEDSTSDIYEVHEYVVGKEDKSCIPVIRLPLIVIICVVIFWNFSLLPNKCVVYCIGIVVFLTYLWAWNIVVEETLVVISSLGIQVQQTNILGKLKYAKFVPIENVKAIIINEIIRRHRVLAYLLVTLDGTESTGKIMVPLLNGTLPRLRTIENIYYQVQKAIF